METNNSQEGLSLSKAQLRRIVLERRNALREKERMAASMVLTERILGHQWYYLSENVLGFVPYGSEIDIREILEDALQKGKRLYLPKVMGDEMQFYKVSSLKELKEGYKGIWEPVGDTEAYVYTEQNAQCSLMLMPGVAFDSLGNRIGYGKGFYDRYLQTKEALQIRTIAVGFQCQMVDVIPAQELDVKPYQIIVV
uniref:5-formyltetrahydrofolate cyclo-ligase n=1 Tax=Acetatifactor sp. TaxID=1872090 RepID=UPI004055BB14